MQETEYEWQICHNEISTGLLALQSDAFPLIGIRRWANLWL
jgi:hypothetical protein